MFSEVCVCIISSPIKSFFCCSVYEVIHWELALLENPFRTILTAACCPLHTASRLEGEVLLGKRSICHPYCWCSCCCVGTKTKEGKTCQGCCSDDLKPSINTSQDTPRALLLLAAGKNPKLLTNKVIIAQNYQKKEAESCYCDRVRLEMFHGPTSPHIISTVSTVLKICCHDSPE